MKKVCIIFLLSIIISLTALGFTGAWGVTRGAENESYLRVHIRADSNEAQAQAVKYLVRDEIVEYLTPLIAECSTKEEAVQTITARIDGIERVAENTLMKNGFSYGARASLRKEYFPTRVYGEYTLPKGEYTALIVELGEGKGDNWWCVVYPPLCFVAQSGTNIRYKSKILEIIQKWKTDGAGTR